jgi:hypothetical protein
MKDEEKKEEKIQISRKDLWKYIALAVLGLLLVVSVVEAVQIQQLKGEGTTASSSPGAAAPQVIAPQRVAQAPAMVGGC